MHFQSKVTTDNLTILIFFYKFKHKPIIYFCIVITSQIFEEQIVHEIHETPREYWPNLLQLIRVFRESVTLKPAEDSLREGLWEAMTGQTLPISDLWKDIDSE